MLYEKPKLAKMTDALTGIQNIEKSEPPMDNEGSATLVTASAYQADE
jgi:hypothetical protein